MKWFWIVLVALLAAGVGTYARYQSLDPCVWLKKDMMKTSGMPAIWVETHIKARFLLDGITEPTATECLRGWWSFRAEELAENGKIE
ncbi:MAG TPA: hypothetical protein VKN76_15735 [Kiloniellaceae bacterium]|nr:hypothetical protein [Kiloniellaceae bacterium]